MEPLDPKNKPAAMNTARSVQKLLAALAASLCLPVLAHAAAAPVALDGDGWTVAPQAEVSATGEQISAPGFTADKWVKAKVPGTVLEAYVVAGIEKEPTYGDNAYKIDQKKYNRNFWYRTEFKTPALCRRPDLARIRRREQGRRRLPQRQEPRLHPRLRAARPVRRDRVGPPGSQRTRWPCWIISRGNRQEQDR